MPFKPRETIRASACPQKIEGTLFFALLFEAFKKLFGVFFKLSVALQKLHSGEYCAAFGAFAPSSDIQAFNRPLDRGL